MVSHFYTSLLTVCLFGAVTMVTLCYAQIDDICIRVPQETKECYQSSLHHPISPTIAGVDCIHKLVWAHTPAINYTDDDDAYFERLSQRFLDDPAPPSGFRQRKEYRHMSDDERERFHRALQILYEEGTIHRYGRLYGTAHSKTHNGAGYLGFHRVLLAFFEEELRRIDGATFLPYWDHTLDYDMDNPVNSVIWSSKLFGNGNGYVVKGDFRGWRGPKGTIQRNYGRSNYGRLTSKEVIQGLGTKCRLEDISYPVRRETDEQFVMEFHNNGVLNWVGGTIANRILSTHDPIFFMVHAFTDYMWETFRGRQMRLCRIDPSRDYPAPAKSRDRGAYDAMPGFSKLQNIDGLSNRWTLNWYKYADYPTCPSCNSKYLWCDYSKARCVSHSRRTDYNVGRSPLTPEEVFEPESDYISRLENVPSMPSPFNDGRTHATAKRDAVRYQRTRLDAQQAVRNLRTRRRPRRLRVRGIPLERTFDYTSYP